MAVAYDNSASTSGTNVSSLSVSVTVGSGSDRAIVCGVGVTSGTPPTVTSSSYASVAMTTHQTATFGSARSTLTYLYNPSSGANTLQANFSGNAAEAFMGGVAFTGVDSATVLGTAGTGAANGSAVSSVASGGANDLIVDCFINNNSSVPSVGAGQTQREAIAGIGASSSAGMSTEAGGASVSMDWTVAGGNDWASVSAAVKEASGPYISVGPQSTTVYEGQSAAFSVTASGSGALTYQWKDDGSNVGADSNSYTTAATVASTDNGAQITCVVSDDNGDATSNAATLSVIPVGKPFYIRA